MIVIDLMHNLFFGGPELLFPQHYSSYLPSAGVVKTHFYHIWVQHKVLRKTKELQRFHAILADVHNK